MDARASLLVLAALGSFGCSEVLGIHDVPVPASNDASLDAAADAPPFTLQCSAATCSASDSVCCLSVCGTAQDSFCVADAGACTSSCVVTVECDRASDCSGTLVCCGAYDSTDVTFLGASCQPLAVCQQGNHRVFCSGSDPSPCPQNAACETSDAGGFEPYDVCHGL